MLLKLKNYLLQFHTSRLRFAISLVCRQIKKCPALEDKHLHLLFRRYFVPFDVLAEKFLFRNPENREMFGFVYIS